MDLKDFQKLVEQQVNEQNNRSVPEFEGYSPVEMRRIFNLTSDPDSPIQFKQMPAAAYKQLPMLNQVKYVMDEIDKRGELKLTSKGYLPVKLVADLYQQGFFKDERIEKGISKLYKETDAISINLTRLLMEMSGLAKKRNGKLSLTKAAAGIRDHDHQLLLKLLHAFITKFNWAYYDGYGPNQIGPLGCGFTFILLSKYGQDFRQDSFYGERYIKAFPHLLNGLESAYRSIESYASNCYSVRTFERFLAFFGLVEIEARGERFDVTTYVRKTAVFDALVQILPHKDR